MEHDLFDNLPPEIITNILSRLVDVRAIASSKCVCKPWLEFLSTDEFVKLHLSRSATALAVRRPTDNSIRFTVFELDDEIDVQCIYDHRLKHLTEFNFPYWAFFLGSANGMLLLCNQSLEAISVCNPISREHIKLHRPELFSRRIATYGFGVSKISGKYKVVEVLPECSRCYVYTLGTGSWRRVEPPSRFGYFLLGVLLNGNLHWLLSDSISCFDLENECFSTFSLPPFQLRGCGHRESLSKLRDCLCYCDNLPKGEIFIWMMKEYGEEKSWTKEYAFKLNPDFSGWGCVYPMQVFKDGDILIDWYRTYLCYYNKTKTTQAIGEFHVGKDLTDSMLLTPSFLSLKRLFPTENVISL